MAAPRGTSIAAGADATRRSWSPRPSMRADEARAAARTGGVGAPPVAADRLVELARRRLAERALGAGAGGRGTARSKSASSAEWNGSPNHQNQSEPSAASRCS